MKYNTMVITGSNGATARELIKYFSTITDHVIGISQKPAVTFPQSNVDIVTLDMGSHSEAESLAQIIARKHGTLDIWINCIGGFNMGSSIQDDRKNWERMHSVNFLTCLHGSQAALSQMSVQGSGRIINIGSKAALDGFANAAAYLISKSSVHMLTRLIALETAGSGITANAVLPEIIDTPANREAMPDEDFTSWQSPLQIAKSIENVIDSDQSGELVLVDNGVAF